MHFIYLLVEKPFKPFTVNICWEVTNVRMNEWICHMDVSDL